MNARICVLVAMVVGALAGCQRDSFVRLNAAEDASIRAWQLSRRSPPHDVGRGREA
jgi:hypothetical protein